MRPVHAFHPIHTIALMEFRSVREFFIILPVPPVFLKNIYNSLCCVFVIEPMKFIAKIYYRIAWDIKLNDAMYPNCQYIWVWYCEHVCYDWIPISFFICCRSFFFFDVILHKFELMTKKTIVHLEWLVGSEFQRSKIKNTTK